MSGFEIAGVVLGGFPILMKCLEQYRESFEPFEEWWNFRTEFVVFVDAIRHQMMRYSENMIRLLDPIVPDSDDLVCLTRDSSLKDPRRHDGSLNELLNQRLGSEHDRFFRILERMQEVIVDLGNLLEIEMDSGKAGTLGEGASVPWGGSLEQMPWKRHFRRMRIAFSKGKHRKVRKLAGCNNELQEILRYSERIAPIADKRSSSEPVRLLEKIRRQACGVYHALNEQWRCDRDCELNGHDAHLRLSAAAVSVSLDLLFLMRSNADGSGQSWQQIRIVPTEATPAVPTKVGQVQHTALLASVQQSLVQENEAARNQNLRNTSALKLANWRSLRSSMKGNNTTPSGQPARNVTFQLANLRPQSQPSTAQPINDLCRFLTDSEPESGILQGNSDCGFRLDKLPRDLQASAAGGVALAPLPELIRAHHYAYINIARQRRFEMASHVASALLQAHTSPWLSDKWCRTEFYFLVDPDSGDIQSTAPLFSRSFHVAPTQPACSASSANVSSNIRNSSGGGSGSAPASASLGLREPSSAEEAHARACLFTVGTIILELIFGHRIEDCPFRKEYYGQDNQPSDETDLCTARRWAKGVLGESGPSIDDVVRRCLDCSFGPRPNLRDVKFRESVYADVIKPLAEYCKTWPEIVA